METTIRLQTVNIVAKLLRPLVEIDLITVPECQEIVANLRHLAEKGGKSSSFCKFIFSLT